MSTWYEVTKEDMSELLFNEDEKEVSFLVCSDDQGNIYLTLSFDQISEIASRINSRSVK